VIGIIVLAVILICAACCYWNKPTNAALDKQKDEEIELQEEEEETVETESSSDTDTAKVRLLPV
jgi:hypothetical protein